MWGRKRKRDLRDSIYDSRPSAPVVDEQGISRESAVETPPATDGVDVEAATPVAAEISPTIIEAETPRRGFWREDVSLNGGAILVALAMGIVIPALGQVLIFIVDFFVRLPDPVGLRWVDLTYTQISQLAVTILFMRLLAPSLKADFGMHLPRGKSYIGPAIFFGLLFGVVMAAVDHAPEIIAQRPPINMSPSVANIAGWLSFQGLISGLTDEPLYRGLIATYLMVRTPGRMGWGRFDIPAGGVVAAAIWAVFHSYSYWIASPLVVLGQQVYIFVLGVLFAFWLNKSKSLLAPIVGHNISGLVEYALVFAMVAAWR